MTILRYKYKLKNIKETISNDNMSFANNNLSNQKWYPRTNVSSKLTQSIDDMTTRTTIAISQERRRYIIIAEQGHCLKRLKERYIQYDTVASHVSFKLAMCAFWIISTHWSYLKATFRSLSILSFLFLIWSINEATLDKTRQPSITCNPLAVPVMFT